MENKKLKASTGGKNSIQISSEDATNNIFYQTEKITNKM